MSVVHPILSTVDVADLEVFFDAVDELEDLPGVDQAELDRLVAELLDEAVDLSGLPSPWNLLEAVDGPLFRAAPGLARWLGRSVRRALRRDPEKVAERKARREQRRNNRKEARHGN